MFLKTVEIAGLPRKSTLQKPQPWNTPTESSDSFTSSGIMRSSCVLRSFPKPRWNARRIPFSKSARNGPFTMSSFIAFPRRDQVRQIFVQVRHFRFVEFICRVHRVADAAKRRNRRQVRVELFQRLKTPFRFLKGFRCLKCLAVPLIFHHCRRNVRSGVRKFTEFLHNNTLPFQNLFCAYPYHCFAHFASCFVYPAQQNVIYAKRDRAQSPISIFEINFKLFQLANNLTNGLRQNIEALSSVSIGTFSSNT